MCKITNMYKNMYIFLVRSVHVLSILEESVYGVGGRGRSKTLRLKITSAAQNYFHIWAVPVQSHVFMLSTQKKSKKKKYIYVYVKASETMYNNIHEAG